MPGLAAFLALGSSNQQVNHQLQIANHQLQIAEQGQITDRYNAAITNLGSRSIEVRLGGIYALQRLMQDSPRDQPTIIAVLCAFVRDQTAPGATPTKPPTSHLPTDIQAALTVVGTRNTAHDSSTTVVDLDHAQLTSARFSLLLGSFHLSGADFFGTDLTRADLSGADLTNAILTGANLTRAYINGPNLTGAYLISANLTSAILTGADLSGANLTGTILTGAKWSKNVPAPEGWIRDPGSGRLRRGHAGS